MYTKLTIKVLNLVYHKYHNQLDKAVAFCIVIF